MRRLGNAIGSPLRLLLLGGSFALAGYAGLRLVRSTGDRFGVVLWVVGAALLHDLVLLPLYAAADRVLVRAVGRRRTWAGYVRVPAALSLMLLLVWFPLISGQVAERYASATGRSPDGFRTRWLLVTAALSGGSALLFALRLRRATKQRPPAVH